MGVFRASMTAHCIELCPMIETLCAFSTVKNMSPNIFGNSATLFLEASQQNVQQDKTPIEAKKSPKAQIEKPKNPSEYKWSIVWRNVIAFAYLHVGSLYALYLIFYEMKGLTVLWATLIALCAALGITAGAHRLWCHRSYKAKWPLRFILMIFQTIAFQNHIYEWVRDHRVHHKFTDTDADPHNAKRGFFFSHIGWLMLRKHPDVINKGKLVDMSDLDKDPLVVWQRRLYVVLMPVCSFLIPTWVPCYFWNEGVMLSWYATVFRYTLSLNLTWLVNSAAHIYGIKPYDDSISPTDHLMVAIGAMGEGWHNYHHVFPWDYKAAELGNYKGNVSTAFIDMFAWIGWAYDLKTVPTSLIEKRAARTGDGSRMSRKGDSHHEHSHEGAIWGWGDCDMLLEDIKDAYIFNRGD